MVYGDIRKMYAQAAIDAPVTERDEAMFCYLQELGIDRVEAFHAVMRLRNAEAKGPVSTDLNEEQAETLLDAITEAA